jgi:hypothetical protein
MAIFTRTCRTSELVSLTGEPPAGVDPVEQLATKLSSLLERLFAPAPGRHRSAASSCRSTSNSTSFDALALALHDLEPRFGV